MLRELIYALNGYLGEVFCWDEKTKTVNVANDLPFIQASEQAILNRLCKLSSYFIKFKLFVEETVDFALGKPDSTAKPPPGIYLRAFARALDAYLQAYQRDMLVLESLVVNDGCVGLSSFQSHTNKYQIIFPVVSTIIDNIVDQKLQGCAILEVLFKASKTGIMEVRVVVNRMLQMCNVVFYKHLTLWMVHGMLPEQLLNNKTNKNSEFIINRVACVDNGAGGDHNQSNVTGTASQEIYEVNVGQLPSFTSLGLAERILFVGQSVALFKNDKKNDQDSRRNADECLISESKERDFKRQLSELSNKKVFDGCLFERTIHDVRNHVAQQLYVLIVEKSNLQSQLRKFKDYFLIGRGELFLTFIDQSQNLLRNPPNSATQYDVNLAFEHACRDTMVEEEHRKPFSLLIRPDEAESAPAATAATAATAACTKHLLKGRKSAWSCLQMTASVDWPLHVLFTQPIIDKYNRLFSFLLLVKRIQCQLHHCWRLQRMPSKKHRVNATKWRLRNHMAFFVDNLQYYLQVDVIDSQFSVLISKLATQRDFERVLLAHETFLHTLLTQSFLHSKQFHGCLLNIFDLCQAYYGLVVYSNEGEEDHDDGGDDNDAFNRRLKEIDEAFRKQSSLLFQMLSTNARCSNHLSLLLLRIDFNRYFSTTAS